MTIIVYVEVQTLTRDHGAHIGLRVFIHGFRDITGRTFPSILIKADLLQGSRLTELLVPIQPSVVHPRHTDALRTISFWYLGFAGLLKF